MSSAVVATILALMTARPFDRWVDLFPAEPGQRWAGSLTVWAVVATTCAGIAIHVTRDALD